MTSQRRARLIAALGFLQLRWAHKPQVVSALESWLNSWLGIGDIVVGMHAQGYDIQLQQYPEGWRANFYTTGIAHSVVAGSAWEPTPWRAVQAAALGALRK